MDNIRVDIKTFNQISDALFKYIISTDISRKINTGRLVKELFGSNQSVEFTDLINKINHIEPLLEQSFFKRIVVVLYALDAYKQSSAGNLIRLDTIHLWRLIYESLIHLHKENEIIASVSSQGFLSLPLYKYESGKGDIELLRLHIWDDSLDKYINRTQVGEFSIHSHLFHAQSWILYGEIINNTYELAENISDSNLSLFQIEWDQSKNDKSDFNRKSHLRNINIPIQIKTIQTKVYNKDATYEIDAGEFHKTENNRLNETIATLFLFSRSKGKVDNSFLLGPSGNLEGPDHEYNDFNCVYLLNKLDNLIIRNGGK